MERMWSIFYIVFITGCVQARVRLDPLVSTNQGLIRGLQSEDGDYSMFLGIPYAQVNVSNPFGDSSPQPPFETVFDAFDDSAICPQIDQLRYSLGGTLDCLHLNIYVPDVASSRNRLPVLVWIHGGGFLTGSAERYYHGPKHLVRHDVVLVTINYRLGPYGFFCLDIPEVPGNQGLKDQSLALRWIRDNIASFGGDNNQITIMGESAGSVSVESHIYSNQEKLFNKVIMQSGSIIGPWAVGPSDNSAPLQIAEKLGFATDDVYAALSFLSNTNTDLVIAATSELSLTFSVCIEREFENVESFITTHPEISSPSKARSTPVLAGFNSHELLMMYVNDFPESYVNLNVFHDTLNMMFDFGDQSQEMEDIVRHFYIGDEQLSQSVAWKLADFSSDFFFNYPTQRSLQKLLENGASSLYFYVFAYSGERNFAKIRSNITEGGAIHADEIGYLFDVSYEVSSPTAEDQLVIDMMTTLWTNFVKSGNPTPETTELLPVTWLPITNDELRYLEINSELTAGSRPYNSRSSFWDLFFKTNEQNLIVRQTQN